MQTSCKGKRFVSDCRQFRAEYTSNQTYKVGHLSLHIRLGESVAQEEPLWGNETRENVSQRMCGVLPKHDDSLPRYPLMVGDKKVFIF